MREWNRLAENIEHGLTKYVCFCHDKGERTYVVVVRPCCPCVQLQTQGQNAVKFDETHH